VSEKLKKWEGWLEIIFEDMSRNALSRTVHTELVEIIKKNRALREGNLLFQLLEGWYIDSVVMALRRQLKSDKQSISLARLLIEVREAPEILTRVRFVKLYEDSVMLRVAEKTFDQYAQLGAPYIDPDLVSADLLQLSQRTEKCERLGDRAIAHKDMRGPGELPTYADLNKALDFAEGLLRKYTMMIKADYLPQVAPMHLDPWQDVLDIPWRSHR